MKHAIFEGAVEAVDNVFQLEGIEEEGNVVVVELVMTRSTHPLRSAQRNEIPGRLDIQFVDVAVLPSEPLVLAIFHCGNQMSRRYHALALPTEVALLPIHLFDVS